MTTTLRLPVFKAMMAFLVLFSVTLQAQITDPPTPLAGTAITTDSFIANWEPVPAATSYRLDVSTSPTFGNPILATDLFISEYVEGGPGYKAVEIYNGTGADINLGTGGYRLRKQQDGVPGVYDQALMAGVIPNGATWVATFTGPAAGIAAVANLTSIVNGGPLDFDGNDAIILRKNGVDIDVVGVIDQAAAWGADMTLKRKSSVTGPTMSYSINDWDAYPMNDIADIGMHTMTDFAPSFTPGYEDLTVNGTSQVVSGLTENTDYYYRVRAVGSDGTSVNSTPTIHVRTLAVSTFGSIVQAPGITCQDTNAIFNLTGLSPMSTYNITYNIDGGPTQTATDVFVDASGNANMEAIVSLVNDGQTLTVTSVERTDVPSTIEPITTNNTVVLDVTASTAYYQDLDLDSYGDINNPVQLCEAQQGFVLDNTDCNDLDFTINPGAQEICNGIDDDCDGLTDGEDPSLIGGITYYADVDADGYGDNNAAIQACSVQTGYVTNNADCDDTKTAVHPGATEIGYNLIDDDCDGSIDEGFPQIGTVLEAAMCNTTLTALDTQLVADLVAGAQGYQWKITNMTNNTIQTLDTPLRVMKLSQLSTYAFNTTYKVELAVYFGGFLQPYTPSTCTVSTPATPTQLTSCSGNATLVLMSDAVYANNVPFAAGYRFLVTDPSNPSNTQELLRATREFRMAQVTNFQVVYNHLYTVKVSIKNTDGTYLPYPVNGCNLVTPLFPTVGLQDSQCDAYVVPGNSTPIYATSYSGAIGYVFQLKGGTLPPAGITVTKQLRAFSLNDFAGQLAPNTTYNVRVRLVFNNADPEGPFGKTCSITTPGSAREESSITKNVFAATAYPNPFADNVSIDVKTASAEKVNVKVYDMTGRLLEVLDTEISEVKTLQIGDRYPSGVYNVIVSQGDEVKTLRVIKR